MFNIDNPFWSAIGKFCDFIALNTFYAFCSVLHFVFVVSLPVQAGNTGACIYKRTAVRAVPHKKFILLPLWK